MRRRTCHTCASQSVSGRVNCLDERVALVLRGQNGRHVPAEACTTYMYSTLHGEQLCAQQWTLRGVETSELGTGSVLLTS